ncbi:hypothetical protein NIES4075_68630 [Tolypothrix sp. NIES-4075]|uniref:hypothetical protein n=1 Tax=Tolypothrix sp. NIES-4075 TaxID=2005459 RepID=UPI000B5CC74C|nr:hypothetical protein [Tolypothrix sp. NIES-4075]GAX45842.1 hypothetical protein NIES4075_68630 [Tolypothrix sp. NIES-4075]
MLLFQLFSSGLIIAQTSKVGEEASRITEDGAAASAAIAESMNGLWDDVLSGGLYGAIAQLGVFFGVGTLLLFVVQWAKDMVDGDNPKAFSELIWPLVVVVLLSNQAQPLAAATRGLREIINQTNQTLLTSTSASIQLQEAYQRAMADIGSQDAARSLLTQCESIADPQQRRECMENAIAQAKQIADSSPNGGKGWFPDFGVSEFFNTNVFQLAVRGWLIAFSIAFQWMIEISMLLTALMGPLAVGGSLLPVGQKAIFAWLTGFFSVGMVKISFNIISGLVATLVVNAQENDPMIFAFATGLLAPILAMVIAAGGGMAVFNSLSSITRFGLSSVVTRILPQFK